MPAKICIIGRRFGRLKVIKEGPGYVSPKGIKLRRSFVQCDCGKEFLIVNGSLANGSSRSCGCLKRDTDRGRMLHDYTGERIGRLVVLEQTSPMPRRWTSDRHPLGKLMRMWKVRCDCGVERIIQTQTLRKQKSSGYGSCGCWRKERNREERNKRTKPYSFYLNRMRASARPRGVSCNLTYEELLRLIPENGCGCCHYCGDSLIWMKYDMGKKNPHRKSGHNFDRKDNNLGYEESNLVHCCGNCNRTRGDRFSYDEFMEIAIVIRAIRERRLEAGLDN
jgi:hypothetical protein